MNLWKVAASGKGAPGNVPKTLSEKINKSRKSKLPAQYRHFEYAWGSQHSQFKILPAIPSHLEQRKEGSKQSIMEAGDVCLFYTQDVQSDVPRSAFFWMAEVKSDPFYDPDVSEALWGSRDFPVIYELKEPQEILLTPSELGEILDPNGEMHRRFPQGLMAVQTPIIESNYEVLPENAIPLVVNLIARKSGFKKKFRVGPSVPSMKDQLANITLGDVLEESRTGTGKRKNANGGSSRHSTNAKDVGDYCEKFVYEYFKKMWPNVLNVKNVAAKKLGWDLEVLTNDGEKLLLEVKGTTTSKMENFEITEREWSSAKEHGQNYWCVLVSNCYKNDIKLQLLKNPAKMYFEDEAAVEATRYRFSKKQRQ